MATRATTRTIADVSDTTAPTLLDGRYRLLAQLAVGSTSTVHLATDTVLDRTVAVKVLHAHLAADPAVLDRFRREALAAASLAHPHVVTLFDVSRDAAYLVMEHVDGPSLRDILRVRGRVRPAEALALLGPVAAGLSAAHAAGMVHRDVKPENVLTGPDGRVRIGDFGLARAAASASTTFGPDMFAGSPSYAAPEAVRGEALDARADVYALGVMLYECLVGRTPLRADTPFATAMLHTTERIPAPSESDPSIPRAVDEVVLRATAPDPAHRYPDAAAFAAALEAAVPDGPAAVDLRDGAHDTVVIPVDATATVVTRTSRPSRLRRFGTLLRRRLWVTLLVVALVVGGGGWLTWDRVLAPVTALPAGLVGAEADAAETALEEAGFAVSIAEERRFSRTVPVGHVAALSPDGTARRGATVTLVLSAGPRQVEVPAVQGAEEAEAVARLEADGFVARVERAFDENVPAGRVVTTTPAAGERADDGSEVVVVVSQGRQPIEVPSVVGLPEGEARRALEDLGLIVEVVGSAFDDEVPAGAILTQSVGPDAGPLYRGDVVEVTVSDGPEPFELPNVREMPEADAVELLEGLGLVVEVRYVDALFGIGAGRVGQQSPSAGTMVVRGDTVSLVVLR